MRRTSHRRRYHTDRIVDSRRNRYRFETPLPSWERNDDNVTFSAGHLKYGFLAHTDPWDCGVTRCGFCHGWKFVERRSREGRLWRAYEDAANG